VVALAPAFPVAPITARPPPLLSFALPANPPPGTVRFALGPVRGFVVDTPPAFTVENWGPGFAPPFVTRAAAMVFLASA
jgi:hypothetical protein